MINLKGERRRVIAQIKADVILDVQKLITKEIVIAIKEGQPTSRLTSLYMKINEL